MNTNKVDLNKARLVDLTKKVAVVLEKKQFPAVKVQVGFAIDVSGSAEGFFRTNVAQEIINRIQALALRFDDNGILDMWAFDDKVIELPEATESMFGSYVEEHILTRHNLWNGTKYASTLLAIQDHYFSAISATKKLFSSIFKKQEEKTTDPVYLVFVTDGDNQDVTETTKVISALANEKIYIQFVAIGQGSQFKYIKGLAQQFGHVGFVDFSNPSAITDETMLDALLNAEFLEKVKLWRS
jgi:hypothetical protein